MTMDIPDETTGTRAYHDAEERVITAEVAAVHSERILRRHELVLNSLRELYVANGFGEAAIKIMKQPVRGG